MPTVRGRGNSLKESCIPAASPVYDPSAIYVDPVLTRPLARTSAVKWRSNRIKLESERRYTP